MDFRFLIPDCRVRNADFEMYFVECKIYVDAPYSIEGQQTFAKI